MTESNPSYFSPDSDPEFTIARITGDDLPTPVEFADSQTESQLYDLQANIGEKILALKEEEARIASERNRMERARVLVASALSLAKEKGIE